MEVVTTNNTDMPVEQKTDVSVIVVENEDRCSSELPPVLNNVTLTESTPVKTEVVVENQQPDRPRLSETEVVVQPHEEVPIHQRSIENTTSSVLKDENASLPPAEQVSGDTAMHMDKTSQEEIVVIPQPLQAKVNENGDNSTTTTVVVVDDVTDVDQQQPASAPIPPPSSNESLVGQPATNAANLPQQTQQQLSTEPDYVEEHVQGFRFFDPRRTGVVTCDDMEALLGSLRLGLTAYELQRLTKPFTVAGMKAGTLQYMPICNKNFHFTDIYKHII
jgi:hypothetical protein